MILSCSFDAYETAVAQVKAVFDSRIGMAWNTDFFSSSHDETAQLKR